VKQFFITIAGVFVGLALFIIGVPLLLAAMFAPAADGGAPQRMVLAVDLRQDISDQPPQGPFASFGGGLSVTDLVQKLQAAETDPKVQGVIVRASEFGLTPASAEEIRQSLFALRQAGKFVIAHAQGFENPSGLSAMVAVSAADEIWMQEASTFAASGLSLENLFLGGAFARFGVIPQFEQFYEYKNAANGYTEADYTPAHREAETSLLSALYEGFIATIATDRKMTPAALKAVLENAPLDARAAQAAKLVDKLGRPEDAIAAAMERANGDIVDIADYAPPAQTGGPVIALVGGEGAIITGPAESSDPFGGDQAMVGDALALALREAADDASVQAIVFRVSSPGGSAIASDQIWAAVEYAKAAGKPVVVSMGQYAASGGYYVSAGADWIVAQPTTITGSIGVLGGKLVVDDALRRYTGANLTELAVGAPYATAFSPSEPFTNSQREGFRRSLEAVYQDFTGKVAAGREMPIARVQEIARGRVWTGAQALRLDLVDSMGGLRTAVAKARELAEIAPDAKVELRSFPAQKSPLEALSAMFGASAEGAQALVLVGRILGEERLAATLSALARADQPGVRLEEPMLAHGAPGAR
jgi:protease-4